MDQQIFESVKNSNMESEKARFEDCRNKYYHFINGIDDENISVDECSNVRPLRDSHSSSSM